jgi:hypothetical protein
VADASQGSGVGFTSSAQALPPLYVDASLYRETQERLGAIEAAVLLSAHHDVERGPAVGEFLARSARFVERSATLVARIVRDAGRPVGVGDVATELGKELSTREAQDYGGALQLLCAARTHLAELARGGEIGSEGEGRWHAA